MKKLLCLLLSLASISVMQAQNYLIEGTAESIPDGTKVYLGEKKQPMIDSTIVKDGSFRLENKLTEIKPIMLFVGKAQQLLLLDENPIKASVKMFTRTVKGKEVSAPRLFIEGDKEQALLKKMNDALAQEMLAMLAISFMDEKERKQMADTIALIYTKAKENTKLVFDSIVQSNPDSYVSALIIRDHFAKERPLGDVEKMYDRLSDRVKNAAPGRTLHDKIQSLQVTEAGRIAPDFTLSTPDGRTISLSSLRGKCVLIDFWASWCGPCLREVPNVKKVYDKYHQKGFEILSVSLDDKKENWEKAIQKYGLNWLHVSSLKGWHCPVAKLYNVSSVPAMFLIDAQGRIVTDNARGENLEKEVSKLCK